MVAPPARHKGAKVFCALFFKKAPLALIPLYITLLHAAFAAELAAVTPIVLLLLAVGLITAIFQAALQIEDATFSLLPKSFAMIFIGLSGGFGAMAVLERFAVYFIGHAAILVHQSWS